MNIQDELATLVRGLDAAAVEYALVGGLAVAVWGAPRYTADIDLLVLEEELARALAVARAAGFDLVADPMDFADGTRIRRVTKVAAPEMLTLDFLLCGKNAPAWQDRVRLQMGDVPLTVISRESLIRMKVSAGRQQDLLDVQRLRELDR